MDLPLELLRVSAQNVRAGDEPDAPQDAPQDEVRDGLPGGSAERDAEGTVEELAASIREHGLLNPLSVRRVGDGYEVFAGQRRLQALRMLGWATAPCRVVEVDDDGARARSLVENFHRKENSHAEKVRAFSALFEGPCRRDKRALMRLVGIRSQRTVDRYLRLGTLVPEVIDQLDGDEPLSLAAADSLVDLPPEEQEEAARSLAGPDPEQDAEQPPEPRPKKPKKPRGPWLHSPDDGAPDPVPIAPEHLSAMYKYYMALQLR